MGFESFALHDPIVPDPEADKKEDIERMFKELLALFESIIREQPEQYFWYNKRWVLDPLEPEVKKEAS